MMLKNLSLATALTVASFGFVSTPVLAQSISGSSFQRSEALGTQNVRLGEVLMVRTVEIEGKKGMGAGTVIGGAVGYGVARSVSGRHGNNFGTAVIGSVLGGATGQAVQGMVTRRRGVQIFVRDLEKRGQPVVSIVQEDDQGIRSGDKVFLSGSGSRTRVIALNSSDLR